MAGRRVLTAREQHELLAPWRTAAPARHPDLDESLRLHGVVHTTGGRRLPVPRLAADHQEQEARLADPAGWQRHVTFRPSGLAITGARAYAGQIGLPDPHQYDFSHVMQTPETVRTVGRLYDAMPDYDRRAEGNYDAFRREVARQHDFITNRLGVRTETVDHDPYSDVHEMMDDINNHKRLKVMGTHVTGGHPYLSDRENDMFRAAHDFFGHAATGRSFDRNGEQATYLAHSLMFSPAARAALATETKGQNSSLILNGQFGPQKVGVLPPEHWDDQSLGQDLSQLPRHSPAADSRTASRQFTAVHRVLWHEDGKMRESAPFEDFDQAKVWAQATLHPFDVNGRVTPNVPEEGMFNSDGFDRYGREYQSGVFAGPNKYALIVSGDKQRRRR